MSGARGYTLVEVLVAVTVFGLLAAGAWTALDGLSRAAEVQRERAERFGALQLAVARLDSDLRQIVSRPVRGAGGQVRPALAGDEGELVATRAGWANPGGQRRGQLQRFGWRVSGGELVRRYWPVTDIVADTRHFDEAVLDGISQLRLRYRGRDGDWRQQWQPEAAMQLPAAVEVQLETADFGVIRRVVVLQ